VLARDSHPRRFGGRLHIEDNPALCVSLVEALVARIGEENIGGVTIWGNDRHC
jgi:hypothetical protein